MRRIRAIGAILLIIFTLLTAAAFFPLEPVKTAESAALSEPQESFTQERDGFTDESAETIAYASTSAAGMAVLEITTGRILYQYRAFERRPMASTTKIITAITVLENTDDIKKVVQVPKACAGIEGSSVYLKEGEKISVEDLLYGLMLQSGNDCAETLAVITSGSVEKFAELMNATAVKAGAHNSNFVNPHGLHDDAHYTTAYDLALITAYAMKNETFAKIAGTKVYRCTAREGEYKTFPNKNKLLSSYAGATGVKTGYTKKAGRCLVAASEREGLKVVAVVLNCGPMFEECRALMDKAHREYEMAEILPAHNYMGEAEVSGSNKKKIRLFTLGPCYYPLRESERQAVTLITEMDGKLKAPLKKYQEVGKVKVYFSNQLLFTEKIYTMEDAGSIKLSDRLKELAENWFGK